MIRTFICLVVLSSVLSAPAGDGYMVVVNEKNADSALTAKQVSRMFLKKLKRWPSGQAAIPIDLPEGDAARAAFSTAIHKKDVKAIQKYWLKQTLSGQNVNPEEKGAADLLAAVAADPGAIGYVPEGTALPGGVKALEVN